MPFTTAEKNTMLDAVTGIDGVRLHSGDPGAAGTSNPLGAGISSATFSAASAGRRYLSSDVTVTGLTPSQSVTYFSAWRGATFVGSGQIVSGSNAADGAGEFVLDASTTYLTV